MSSSDAPLHVAVIMDGNGRWAAARGRPRLAGHRAGARVVRRIVEAAPSLGVGTLTLYAFSADNWRRPPLEVEGLMHLFGDYLRAEVARCLANDVRLSILGRRDRIPPVLVDAIAHAERATADGRRLHLRIALDYSARDAILRAAACLPPGSAPSRESFGRLLSVVDHGDADAPPVDLLVRTGGERRLSDFLLWECAYAELHFTPRAWPDFRPTDLAAAMAEFRGRERRFGGLAPAAIEPLASTPAAISS
ncbi:MAG TPA: di-trans,poly-cis-decaprenylcistransferase [Gemmatimonadales bacterium]|nr:di-trans,poly-cis-decaprenylcistransferase [Gemmatimonadales bacterium]